MRATITVTASSPPDGGQSPERKPRTRRGGRCAPRPFAATLRAFQCDRPPGIAWRRGWDSNPRTPVKMLLEFQSSAFDRSATSPINQLRCTPRTNSWLSEPAPAPSAARQPDSAARANGGRRARRRMIHLQAWGGAGLATLKAGGASRQGSLGPRGGGAGSLSAGTCRALLVSGASSPAGMRSGAMLCAFVYGCTS